MSGTTVIENVPKKIWPVFSHIGQRQIKELSGPVCSTVQNMSERAHLNIFNFKQIFFFGGSLFTMWVFFLNKFISLN